jgi:hypothetical protein
MQTITLRNIMGYNDVNDRYALHKLHNILKYANNITYEKHNHGYKINNQIMIAKRKTLFRLLGTMDWVWYTPKGLGTALNEGTVEIYYEHMTKDKRSPTNEWKNKDKEMSLKTEYAERCGKASSIKSNT